MMIVNPKHGIPGMGTVACHMARFSNMKNWEPNMNIWLVGQGHPSEKYEFVTWDDEIPNMWEN